MTDRDVIAAWANGQDAVNDSVESEHGFLWSGTSYCIAVRGTGEYNTLITRNRWNNTTIQHRDTALVLALEAGLTIAPKD